jgi:GntR family transcriptional regulator
MVTAPTKGPGAPCPQCGTMYGMFVQTGILVRMDQIDRNSAEPYYLQLARILANEIRSGKYPSGARVPGETALCRTYDLSRSTVRETLRALEQDRLIRMVPRRGAFVGGNPVDRWTLQVTQGFLETGSHLAGRSVETSVIRAEFARLTTLAASALDVPEGTEGFILERMRRVDTKPAIYSTNYLPPDVAAALLDKPVLKGEASLNQTLREAGFGVYSARREVAAVAAPPETAKTLQVARGSPVLLIQSISRDERGRPFDFYQSYVRTDVVVISVDAQAGERRQNHES